MMVFTSCNICACNRYREVCDIKISPTLTPSKLVKCVECGFYYANPRLSQESEEDYYKVRYHEECFRYEDRAEIFKMSLCEIGRFIKKGKLIDVGCGMGNFMDLAKSNGWEVKGVEISDYAVNYARERFKLDVTKGSLRDARFEREYFDAATMWNVLDQTYDPKADLTELNRILKKGGYLFIRVPNIPFNLMLQKFYNRLRPLFRGVRRSPSVFHLYSFDKNSIKRLLKSAGFSSVIVKPAPSNIGVARFSGMFDRKKEISIKKLFDLEAGIVYFLSFGKIIMASSIFIIAQK
jgi:ubiquinone/menaquinone biosynthesis C-methylase UbiE